MTDKLSPARTADFSPTVTDERIDTLELKLMDLENTVQELNEVILRQYRDIEQLRMQQAELLNRVLTPAEGSPAPSIVDELPPHY